MSALWLETSRGHVAVEHVAAVEYERTRHGSGYGVVVRLAVTAGDSEMGFEPLLRTLATYSDVEAAASVAERLVWEIAHQQAAGAVGILRVARDTEGKTSELVEFGSVPGRSPEDG